MARRRSRTRAKAKRAGYRSGFEQSIGDAAGKRAKYESLSISWQPKPKKYKPDFQLENGIIVEAKGRFTVFDRMKHLAIKEQHPELDIRFVFQYDNRLDKRSRTTYSEWAASKGFKFAFGTIPEGWYAE